MAIGVAVLWALALYQPWQPRPFSILDFSEFLPLLHRASNPIGRLHALTAYYHSQGRSGILSYAFIVLNWSMFGASTVGWQMMRFCLMLAVAGGVLLLLRQFGASRAGAVIGASLFIYGTTAVQGWLRLTGEPLGLVILLTASSLALRYQEVRRWRLAAAAVSILLFLMLFTKETLIAAAPFVLLIACCRGSDGEWRLPRHTRRNVWLVAGVSLAVIVALLPIAITALRAHGQAYVASYGTGRITWRRFRANFETELLPVRRTLRPDVGVLLFPANFLFLIVLAGGWQLRFARARDRFGVALLLAVALTLPLAGAIVYLPWPRFEDFYGLPFLLASALLLALAVTSIEEHSPRRAALASYVACAAVVLYSSALAQRTANTMMARDEVNGGIARAFGALADRDSIVVGARSPAPQAWQGTGATLRRYAVATGDASALPPVIDASCSETLPLYRAGVGRAALVTYSDQCGSFPAPTKTIRQYFHYVDWKTLTLRTDSLRADILAPSMATRSAPAR